MALERSKVQARAQALRVVGCVDVGAAQDQVARTVEVVLVHRVPAVHRGTSVATKQYSGSSLAAQLLMSLWSAMCPYETLSMQHVVNRYWCACIETHYIYVFWHALTRTHIKSYVPTCFNA